MGKKSTPVENKINPLENKINPLGNKIEHLRKDYRTCIVASFWGFYC